MSTTYNPNSRVVQATSPAPVAIASSTGATPIVVTTATPHGYVADDCVQIIGHDQAAANGLWQVTVVDATRFSLKTSIGTGAGGAIGQAQDFSVNPLLTLPGDGDLESASSVNAPISGQANVAPFLYQRVGKYKTHEVYQAGTFLSVGNAFSATAVGTATWTTLTGLGNVLSALADRYLASGDILEVLFTSTIFVQPAQEFALAIGLSLNGGAASPQSYSVRTASNAGASSLAFPIACSVVIDSGFSANDRFDLSVLGYSPAVPVGNLSLMTGFQLECRHLRSNA